MRGLALVSGILALLMLAIGWVGVPLYVILTN